MTIEQAKKIAIADYLQSNGFTFQRQKGINLWYYSPFRTESEPSFKVNLDRNEWYDFGMGKGGNIIALVMKLNQTDIVSEALKIISDGTPTVDSSFSFRQQESLLGFEDVKVRSLANRALLQYIDERKISIGLARQFCQEIYFKSRGKPYFAIGFENSRGGFELRNRYFKGTIAPKDITIVSNGSSSCCIFEGFMDYLSYLTLRKQHNLEQTKHDYIVLNSVGNLSKAIPIIDAYNLKQCYLDNDTAGKNAFAELLQKYGSRLFGHSENYQEYKDVNDYLCGKKMVQEVKAAPIVKPKRMKM